MVIENMNKKTKIFHDFIRNKEKRENKLGPLKQKFNTLGTTKKYVIK